MSAVSEFRPVDYDVCNHSSLEVLDYIPLVSTISGIARAVFGSFETVVGVVALPVQVGARICNYKQPFILALGVSNVVRGVIAAKPILGNILLYLYDHSQVFKNDFQRACGIKSVFVMTYKP